MKISIGSDHRGFQLKEFIIKHYQHVSWLDKGAFSDEKADYPMYAGLVAQALLSKEVQLGILLCGSGVGMSISANRYKGVYAALVWCPKVATLARQHDNANILVLPADFLTQEQATACIDAWLAASFSQGHYAKRLGLIDK